MNQTITELYQQIKDQLSPIAASQAQVNAEADWILRDLFHLQPSEMFTQGERIVTDGEQLKLNCFLEQRVGKRIPIQYLTHEAWFYGHRFYINSQVLIPRPETELLVEETLRRLKPVKPDTQVLDLGVGSGAIAISLSLALGKEAQVFGTDISPAALKVSAINQKLLGSAVNFLPPGDLFMPIGSGQQFNAIVSNPPYISPSLKDSLKPEVLWHEPHSALFPPGDDPYHYYQRIAQESPNFLKPDGMVLVEVGEGMASTVSQIFLTQSFAHAETIRDYASIDRIVVARR